MDEISPPQGSQRPYKVLTFLYIGLVVFAIGYIIWRGFVGESGKPPVPLFGETAMLEWQGQERPFVLSAYAEPAKMHPGDLVIREREVPPIVWQVASLDAHHLSLKRGLDSQEVSLPLPARAPRFVLLAPGKAH